ncbi:hypothetical protein POM88_037996 [Heracleum sosnowskyi]|uniref:H15 domain-containing protein n=1 Tax=Heracleum sosnowskyi TaxID=360622 RepID=A0AAD8HR59_9APIA|nr:hypothetical protein POM88_037996 [Heracleum sosnowskyi]
MEAHSDLPVMVTQPDVQISDVAVENTAAQFNNNPTYEEMITAAILALKEKDGSSRQAIDKFIGNEYQNLSPSHGTLLTYQLKRMKNEGKLVMNKHSYMIPGIEFVVESVGEVSIGSKKGRGRPRKVQANGGGGVVDLEAPPVSVGVIGDSGIVGNVVPFDPIGAVPNVVPIGEVDGGTVVKRRPGRPPKSQAAVVGGEPIAAAEPISVGRRPGRPPKVNNGMVGVENGGSILGKRGRGRPPKKLGVGSGLVGNVGGMKKGRGRPAKFTAAPAGMVIGQRQRGRPRKGTVSRPRGRPRKNVPVNGGGAAFFPVDGMEGTGRPAKMAVRRNTRKLSGKPLGRPKKDASALAVQAFNQQPLLSYQDLKGRVEHFQSRVNQAVDVILSYINPEVAPIAVGMLQELQEISLIDMIGTPFSSGPGATGIGAAVTDLSVAPSDDQGGQGSDPFAPLSARLQDEDSVAKFDNCQMDRKSVVVLVHNLLRKCFVFTDLTAEALRKDHPNEDWLQLSALFHGILDLTLMSYDHDISFTP